MNVTLICFGILVIGGSVMYICTCDSQLAPLCLFYDNYNEIPSQIINKYNPCVECVETNRICSAISCNEACVRNGNRECYDVIFEFTKQNCSFTYLSGQSTQYIDRNNKSFSFYVKKSNKSCSKNPNQIILFVFSLLIMIMGYTCGLLAICGLYLDKCDKTENQPGNTNGNPLGNTTGNHPRNTTGNHPGNTQFPILLIYGDIEDYMTNTPTNSPMDRSYL